jgi:hypothetical protein
METLVEIEERLRKLQSDRSVDLIQSFASMLHQEQRRSANALVTIGQCNEVVARQTATLLDQTREISRLEMELAKLRAKVP